MIVSFFAFSVLVLFIRNWVHAPPRFILIIQLTKNIFFSSAKLFVRKMWHTATTYVLQHRELGVPMGVHVSFQLSALLQPDPAFPLLENVNRTKLVPLFWATEGFSTPTPWMVSTTNLALSLPSLGAQVDQQAHWHHENQHHHLQGISIGLLLLGGVLTLITLAMGALARWGLFLPRTCGCGCNVFQKIHKYGTNDLM